MAAPMWTFARSGERLVIRREGLARRPILILQGPDWTRRVPFRTLVALVRFQTELEAALVRSGWSLAEFSRNGDDLIRSEAYPRR